MLHTFAVARERDDFHNLARRKAPLNAYLSSKRRDEPAECNL